MFKCLVVVALAIYILPVQTYAQPDKAQQASKGEKPSLPTTAVVPQEGGSPTVQAQSNNHVSADVRVISAPSKDGYDLAAFWANLGLVIVGIGGIAVAVITLGTIKRQTKIQAATMRQWIELDDWKSGIDGSTGSYTLLVGFSLLNPTNFLLTISHAEIEFQTVPRVTALLVRKGTPLPPNKPIEINIRLPISDLRQQSWLTGAFGFGIEGKIVFISALEETVVQDISGLVTCSYSEGAKLESVVKLKK